MFVPDVDILMIGAGPSNLALAVALEESGSPDLAGGARILERHEDVKWQRNLLLPWARSQVSYLKDLVTLRNPRSRFSFLNFLHEQGELDEFVNLGTFNPFRWQLSAYQQWVADTLEHVQVRYRCGVEQIRPARDPDGTLSGFVVALAGGATVSCRDLVFGGGRDAYVPEVFAELPAERVVHSTQYSSRIGAVRELAGPGRPLRPLVVGGAQSAAEMFMALHQDAPGSSPTLLLRSIGLKDYQTSKFVNELFYPSFVDEFYAMPEHRRREVLDQMHLTNYAGLAPPFLDEIYTMIYQQRMLGKPVSAVRALTEIVGAGVARLADGGSEVVLDVQDLRTGRDEQVRGDVVLLGTGFDPQMPAIVRRLADDLGITHLSVNRNYRVDLGTGATGALYLQGVNEATHGISDSLISVLAQRSADITQDILHRRHTDRETASSRAGQNQTASVVPV